MSSLLTFRARLSGFSLIAACSLLSAVIFLSACGPSGGGGGSAEDSGPAAESSGDPGEAAKGKPRLTFVTNGVASFWTIAESGVAKAGADLDVDAEVLMPAGGISDQKQILEDLISRNVDGIAVSPIDPENQTALINQAAKRINLITHDSDAPDSDRLCYIGMDNYTAGRMCGALVKEVMPEGGTLMIFIGRLEQDNAKRRRQGVIDELMGRPSDPSRYDPPGDVIEGNNFKILGTLTDQFDRAKGKANAEDALARHPDIDCMVGLFAYNPPLILQALQQGGKVGQVKVVAFDEADETLQGIIDGTVYGTVVQNPYMYGYKSIEVLNELHKGNKGVIPENGFIDIPARQIRKDNVEEFWADLKVKTGKE